MENILIDDYRSSVIIDFGMCLRVPFDDGEGNVTDVSDGGLRRLIRPLMSRGRLSYISPEVLKSIAPFDGFAVDLWATGVVLFEALRQRKSKGQ